MPPFDQIYWNAGIGFADQGTYVSGTTKGSVCGVTSSRNPDSTFSYPNSETSQNEVLKWFGTKANRTAETNIFQGIHLTQGGVSTSDVDTNVSGPLSVTLTDKPPFRGAILVLERTKHRYISDGTKQSQETERVGIQNIAIYKGSAITANLQVGGSPDVDDVFHVPDSGETTQAISSSGYPNRTWGFCPNKYNAAGTATAAFEEGVHPFGGLAMTDLFSRNQTTLNEAGADPNTAYFSMTAGSSSPWTYHEMSSASSVLWPNYENDIANITDIAGQTPLAGNKVYTGIPLAGWDQCRRVWRIHREANVAADYAALRNANCYPYLLADAGYWNSQGGTQPSVEPDDYTDSHFLTIWETDEIIAPGTGFNVTLQTSLGEVDLLSMSVATIKQDDYTLHLIAKN